MDQLAQRRRERAKTRLPSVESILSMFEQTLEARVRVPDDPELIAEARHRVRAAAKVFGRPVETHYVRKARMLIGIVPLTDEETRAEEKRAAKALEDSYRSGRKDLMRR